jgi:hypothetical protein
MVRQIVRSRLKEQDTFDEMFIMLVNTKEGKTINKGLIIDSRHVCGAWFKTIPNIRGTMEEVELHQACQNYIAKYPFTVLVND